MKVGKDGTLPLPEEQRKRWGLKSGVDVLVWETPEGLVLRPADPPLAKVYLEPTTTCNLQCSTCMRSSWDELGIVANHCLPSLFQGCCHSTKLPYYPLMTRKANYVST